MTRIGPVVKGGLDRAADVITAGVGTMYCALAFAGLTFVSLPNVIATHDPVQIIGWIAQTFLQLVLLSVIMVGQRRQGEAVEVVIRETHDVVIEELRILKEGKTP